MDAALIAIFAVTASLLVIAVACLVYNTLVVRSSRAAPFPPEFDYPESSSSSNDFGSNSKDKLDACAVVFGDNPSAKSPGRVTCLDVGKRRIFRDDDGVGARALRPRYIRVASGYTLIAYQDTDFGEPVVYRMRGPAERFVEREEWVQEVRSAVVYLSATAKPDIEPCNAMVEPWGGNGNKQLCLQASRDLSEIPTIAPRLLDLQAGYKLTAYAQPHLVGQPIDEAVGPVHKLFSMGGGPEMEWRSARVVPCFLTLYSEPLQRASSGYSRCVEAATGQPLMPPVWTPMSYHLAAGYQLTVFSQPGGRGRVLMLAAGPRRENFPEGVWSSSSSSSYSSSVASGNNNNNNDTNMKDEDSPTWEGGSFVVEPENRLERRCVMVLGPPGSDDRGERAQPQTCLDPGPYNDVIGAIGFRPVSCYVPTGTRLMVYDAGDNNIINKLGPWRGEFDQSSPSWVRAVVQ
jgi:hypothetical protein